jgi:hypothetical protein
MLLLKENEVCPYAARCPYMPCYGAKANRPNSFKCEFVENGEIKDGMTRLPGDKTGQMKIILE